MLRSFHIGNAETKLTITESNEPDTIYLTAGSSESTVVTKLTKDEAYELTDLLRYTVYGDNLRWVDMPSDTEATDENPTESIPCA